MTPGNIYHIYNHGNAEDNLFRLEDKYLYFLEKHRKRLFAVINTDAYRFGRSNEIFRRLSTFQARMNFNQN